MDWNMINQWHWLGLGGIFLLFELFLPGVLFLWLALAAFVLGGLVWVLPLGIEIQLLLFSILSVVNVILGRWYFKPKASDNDQPLLNERQAQFVGEVYVLHEGIVHGVGKVQINDSFWRVRGEDCPAGQAVRVIDVKGAELFVELVK